MSRKSAAASIVLAGLVVSMPAAAQETSAEQALSRYGELTSVAPRRRCEGSGDPDEILVCARRQPSPRLPLPAERGARAGPRTATGEVAAASAAPVRPGSCGTRAGEVCNGGLPVFQAVGLLVKLAEKIVDPDK